MLKTKKLALCPSCKKENKLVSKCIKCGKLCCSECSIKGECYDCFMGISAPMFVIDYFQDKYRSAA